MGRSRVVRAAVAVAGLVVTLGCSAPPAPAPTPPAPTTPGPVISEGVAPPPEVELLSHPSFAEGLGPWTLYGDTGEATSAGGETCVEVAGGAANPWDAGLTYNGIAVESGTSYRLRVTARTEPATTVRLVVGENGGAYRTVTEAYEDLAPEPRTAEVSFTAALTFPADSGDVGQVAVHLGAPHPFTFCISEVSLTTVSALAPALPAGSSVRVNQVGYLTHGPKVATVVTEATEPLPWTVERAGRVVASGETTPRGHDASAGTGAHTLDFSGVTEAGSGYTVTVAGDVSHPFAVGGGLYDSLRGDSLSFFYPQRSGIEIRADVAGAAYARDAGHVDVAPNRGDGAVGCLPAGSLVVAGVDLYDGWTCDYALDVTGGWYDAGDHGKYVVNGGIAVAQLLGTYERAVAVGTAAALGDGSLRVPEAGNGVPDVLDEARWELEWLLRMRVPAGSPYAGMAHHKVTDAAWTGIPTLPAADDRPRYLHRPSTAATLNLAAVAAQGARVFADVDADFAARLLGAARSAWAAAVATPDLFAPDTNTHPDAGGGPYDDTDLEDEFYWAAAELFLTTGETEFEAAVTANPYHRGEREAFGPAAFDWGNVAALARLQLAAVPSDLADRERVRADVVAAAEATLARQATQPFGTAYVPASGRYDWGSNGLLLNNLVVLGTAFDLTGEARFRDGVLAGLDHLLGRNAVGISYVTGHGTHYSRNQHSRWYAHQADPALPNPPAGTVSGGPNSDVPDPVSGSRVAGCAPQQCYVDDIGAWGVNELTINWNSALAWVAAFAADQGDGGAVGGRR